MSDVQGFNEGVFIWAVLLLLIVFLFFQAANPENKKIQTEKAPTIIEISWLVPLILLTVISPYLFIPALISCLFLRMYFVKIYQLFNPDWRTDGTSVGIQSVEDLGEVLNNLPNPDEMAKDVVDFTIEKYRDKNSLLNSFVSLILWIFSPIIEFHKVNHKKPWFVFYVYFMVIFVVIPLFLASLVILDLIIWIPDWVIDWVIDTFQQTISSFLNTFSP
jgi:hypothetical protein